MITKRSDYSFLLDNLRVIANNYHINEDGNVVNRDNEKEDNEYTILNTKFYTLYCMAYKALVEKRDNCSIDVSNKEFIEHALSDYNTFNSFINNCVFEYKMYNTVGTGNLCYFPNQELANFFFENISLKMVLLNYFKCELSEVFDKEKEKVRVKK